MHHLRSTAAVLQLRLASIMFLVVMLLAPVSGGLLVVSSLTGDRPMMMLGMAMVGFTVLLVIAHWGASANAGCPLCRTPVLARKSCSKHRRARTFAGSHRLRVALAIVFKNRFRCPYCNESTTMELRESLHGSSPTRISPRIPTSDTRI